MLALVIITSKYVPGPYGDPAIQSHFHSSLNDLTVAYDFQLFTITPVGSYRLIYAKTELNDRSVPLTR